MAISAGETMARDIDSKLKEKLRWFLGSAFEGNKEKLRKLEDVKTLIDCYKKTEEYQKLQEDEHGILSMIVNEIIGDVLNQVKLYYVGPIVRKVEIETQFKEEGVVEVNSNISLGDPIMPYVEFTVEINRIPSYTMKFTFELKSSAYITKLRITRNADKGKSIDIETLGVKIEFSLLEIKFSNMIRSRSDISLNKRIKLGSKSFEIHDISIGRT